MFCYHSVGRLTDEWTIRTLIALVAQKLFRLLPRKTVSVVFCQIDDHRFSKTSTVISFFIFKLSAGFEPTSVPYLVKSDLQVSEVEPVAIGLDDQNLSARSLFNLSRVRTYNIWVRLGGCIAQR